MESVNTTSQAGLQMTALLPHRLIMGFMQKLAAITQPLMDLYEFVAQESNPSLSTRYLNAELIEIRQETESTKTYIFKAPKRWQGFQPGMYIPLFVSINGVCHRRNYSISSSTSDYEELGLFSITVKCVENGLVSNWLFHNARAGDHFRIEQARGSFLLKESSHPINLFLAAGSGITPIMSILASSLNSNQAQAFTLIYYANTEEEMIFLQQLKSLASLYENFTVHPIFSKTDGNINTQHITERITGCEHMTAFICGPGPFMDTAKHILQSWGLPSKNIIEEKFSTGKVFYPPDNALDEQKEAEAVFLNADKTVRSNEGHTILELAESAGLKPKHGCRIGVCHECQCKKQSGIVFNRLTGKTSEPGEGLIQACISVPVGQVNIEL